VPSKHAGRTQVSVKTAENPRELQELRSRVTLPSTSSCKTFQNEEKRLGEGLLRKGTTGTKVTGQRKHAVY
jgi:hypothetical protein